MTIDWYPTGCCNPNCSLCHPPMPPSYTTTNTYTLPLVPYVPKHRKPGPAQ